MITVSQAKLLITETKTAIINKISAQIENEAKKGKTVYHIYVAKYDATIKTTIIELLLQNGFYVDDAKPNYLTVKLG